MSGVNKVILVGHLGRDPEVRHLEGGATVASFSLATTDSYTKDGRRVEQTEWHNIVMWRGLAETAAKYLHKGKLVYIEGKLRTRSYEDKEGNKKSVTEVVADSFTMLGRKSDDADHVGGAPVARVKEEKTADYSSNIEDDLPF